MPELQQYEVNVFPNCQESLYVTAEFPPYCRSQSNQPPRGQVASKPALSQQQQRYSAQPQQPQQLPLPQSVSSHASKVLSTHSSSHRGLTNSSSGQATPLQNTASKTIVCESPRVYKTQQGVYTNISDLKLNELKISPSASGNSQPQSQSQTHSHSHSQSQSQHQQQQQPRFEVHNGIQYELAPVVYEDRTGGISPRPSPQPCGACGVSSREQQQQQCPAPTGPAQTAPAPTGPAPTGPAPSQSVVNKVASRPLLPGQLNPRTTSSPPVPPTPAPLGPTLSGFQQQQQRTLSTPPAVPPVLQSAALPAGGFSGVYAPLRPSSGVSPTLSRPPQPCPPGFPANPQLSAPFGAPQLPQTPAPFNFPLRPAPALSLPQQQFSRLLPATPPPPPQFGRIPVQAAPCAPPALPPALPLPTLPPPQAPFSFGAPQLPQFPQFPPSLPALPPPQAPFSFGAPQLPQFPPSLPPQLPQSSCGCGAGPAPLALPPQLPPLPPQLPLALPPPQLPCGPPPLPPMPCGPPPCGPRPQCNFSFGGFAPVSRVVGCGGGLFGGRGCCGGGLGRGCCSGQIGNQCCGPSGIRIGKSSCQQKRQRCAFIRKRRAVYIGPPIIGTLPKPPALPCPPPPCPPPCPRPC